MDGKQLSEALRSGRRVYGTLVVSESPLWPKALENSELDFVFIDTEHTALDRAQVAWMCQAYARMGMAPLVRIPSTDPFAASNALDTGASGIIAPYVESPEQVQALRGAVRLRPLKGRRRDTALRDADLEEDLDRYLHQHNASHVLVVNIESVPAIERLGEILAVPGLDAVLVGPHDLSCSLGIPERYNHPDFMRAVRTIFSEARASGVGAGIHFMGDVSQQVKFLRAGANMLIYSADVYLFSQKLRDDLRTIKRSVGEVVGLDTPPEGLSL